MRQAPVTDRQNCGNILAGIAQFAVEKGLVRAADGRTEVAVHMVNSDRIAEVTIETPGGVVTCEGSARAEIADCRHPSPHCPEAPATRETKHAASASSRKARNAPMRFLDCGAASRNMPPLSPGVP